MALLQSLLRDLGLERRAKPLDVAAALAALHGHPAPADAPPAAVGSTPARIYDG